MNSIKQSVLILIGTHGRMKVSEMIGISSITLSKRLESDKWKKSEIAIINQLCK